MESLRRPPDTNFTRTTLNSSAELEANLIATLNSSALPAANFASDLNTLLILCSDDSSLGAPFGSSNVTFGLGPELKREAVIESDLGFRDRKKRFGPSSLQTHGQLLPPV